MAVSRGRGVEGDLAAEEEVGGHVAQHQVGVGDGRLDAALAVAGRSGVAAGRSGADTQQPQLVDPGDGAAARAAGLDVDHLDGHALVLDPRLGGGRDLAVADHADVEGRAAHVHRQDVARAHGVADVERTGGRRCRPGADEVDDPRDAVVDRLDQPVREHHQQVAREALLGQARHEGAQVALDDRAAVGRDDRGREALVLAPYRQDLVRGRDVRVGQHLAGDLAGAPLVGRVGVGVQEADDHRLHALRLEALGGGTRLGLVERGQRLARVERPFGRLQAQMPRHQRLVGRHEHVVHRGAHVLEAAPDLDDVAEAARRDHPGPGAVAVDERVGGEGRAVDDALDLAHERAQVGVAVARGGLGQRVEEALRGVARRGVALELAQRARLVHDEAVGERAADVDADAIHAFGRSLSPGPRGAR